ncbi:MAG: hypothetical protein ACLFMO_05485 [Eubacteriales bacterium]
MQNSKTILVLGSKPDSDLPAVKVDHIYAANAAIILANNYISIGLTNKDFTSVTTGKQLKKPEVQDSVLSVQPSCIISRRWEIPDNIKNGLTNTRIIRLTDKEQEDFQKQYLGFGRYLAEIKVILSMVKVDIKAGLSRLKAIAKLNLSGGLSTGLYAVLVAAHNHPEHTIIVAGIGLDAGTHFNDNKLKFPLWRGLLDKEMVKYFSPDLKQRIFTTDSNFAKNVGVKIYEGGVL